MIKLFPINTQVIANPSDKNRFRLKLRLVKLKPCKVAIIFHMQIITARKIDDASNVIVRA